ncbi:MAG: hypothetical protein NVSMB18_20030 [Acetobacteraceae bacterium]
MTRQATSTPDPANTETAHHRQTLNDLVDLSMQLARHVHAKALQIEPAPTSEVPNPKPLLDLAAAFDRLSRAIRRTILLIRRLDDPAPLSAPKRRDAARRHILRGVEDAIDRHDPAPATAKTLKSELLDRLDTPDFDDDLDHRPIPDLIVELCRDLGVAEPQGGLTWKRRTPADIKALRTRAARPQQTQPRPDALPTQPKPKPTRTAKDPERAFRLLATPNPA